MAGNDDLLSISDHVAYLLVCLGQYSGPICMLLVITQFMNPFRTGKLVLFQVEYNRDWHYFEIAFFLLMGIFGGLYGEYVLRFNLQVQRFRKKRLSNYGVQEAVVLAILTAMVCYFNRFLRLDMTETLEVLFQQCDGASDDEVLCQSRMQWSMSGTLLMATTLRFVLVILSYGCKVPAGIFIPSMAVGATFGRMVGILVKALQMTFPSWKVFSSCSADAPCITPGTYAMLGAAAALAGVTRITVSVVVIMFELTGALTYILPIMLVVGTAKMVADLNGKGGVADRTIKFNGYPFLDPEDHTYGINVGSMMTSNPDVLYADGMRYSEVDSIVAQGTYRGFPVVVNEQDRTVLGYVERAQLRFAIRHAQATKTLHRDSVCVFHPKSTEIYALTSAQINFDSQLAPEWMSSNSDSAHVTEEGMEVETGPLDLGAWVDPAPLIVQPQLDLEVVSDMFKRLGPRVILVCSNGILQGIVTIKDLLRHIARKEREQMDHIGTSDCSMDARADTGFVIGTGILEDLLENLWHKASSLTARFPWGQRYNHVPDNVPLTSVTTIYVDR